MPGRCGRQGSMCGAGVFRERQAARYAGRLEGVDNVTRKAGGVYGIKSLKCPVKDFETFWWLWRAMDKFLMGQLLDQILFWKNGFHSSRRNWVKLKGTIIRVQGRFEEGLA